MLNGGLRVKNLSKAALAAALVAMPGYAFAAPIVYSGFDSGASAPGANATAAAAAFDLAVSGASIETFEGFTVGANTNGLSGPGYTISSTGFQIRNTSACDLPLCGSNTTAGGENFAYSISADAALTFVFMNPIKAFGAIFGGLQTGTNALKWSDGGNDYSLAINPDSIDGGFAFVGFYDANASISSVTLDIPFDLISVDDVRYGPTDVMGNVPEPATWAMLVLGFGVVGAAIRSRRTVRRAATA